MHQITVKNTCVSRLAIHCSTQCRQVPRSGSDSVMPLAVAGLQHYCITNLQWGTLTDHKTRRPKMTLEGRTLAGVANNMHRTIPCILLRPSYKYKCTILQTRVCLLQPLKWKKGVKLWLLHDFVERARRPPTALELVHGFQNLSLERCQCTA